MTEKRKKFLFKIAHRTLLISCLAAVLSLSSFSLIVPSQQEDSVQTKTLLPDGRWLIFTKSESIISDPKTGTSEQVISDSYQHRVGQTATVLPDGNVLIFGGIFADGTIADAEIFRPDNLTFDPLTAITATPRAYHTATLLSNGKVLIAGGIGNNGETLPTAELYDWQDKTIQTVSSNLQTARSRHKALLQADGSVALYGGKNSKDKDLKNAERFNPESEQFETTNLPIPDTTPLQLAASIPADGDKDTSLDTRITLRFSKEVDVDSVTEKSAILQSPKQTVTTKIVVAENGMLVFINPQQKLLPLTTYTISLKGLRDHDRNELPSTSISFCTIGDVVSDMNPKASDEDEEWTPDPHAHFEKWQTGRGKSPWQSLPALQAPKGVTAVSGQALKLNGLPLPNVTIRFGGQRVKTDDTGRFLATEITPGVVEMIIDGRTANVGKSEYGVFFTKVDVCKGKTNVLPYTIWMSLLDVDNAVNLTFPTTREIIVTTPKLHGFEIHIPSGTVVRDIDGQVARKISITPIPLDRMPTPLPLYAGKLHYMLSLQPGGGVVEGPGIRIVYPNHDVHSAGTRLPLMTIDTNGNWILYGQATVTGDRQQLLPDSNSVIRNFAPVAPSCIPMPPEECKKCFTGDPVACATGLYTEQHTDLYLPDVIPISLTRTYRTNDLMYRPFGTGSSHPYEIFVLVDTQAYTFADLVLENGNHVHYTGSFAGMEANTSGDEYYKSALTWNDNINGWQIKFKNGTIYQFGAFAGTPANMWKLSAILDRNGNKLTILRELYQRVSRIISPNGKWISFTYVCPGGECLPVSQVTDNIGRTVSYTYINGYDLWKVTDANGGVTEYTYEPNTHRVATVKNPRGFIHVTNEYDALGRVFRQTRTDNTTWQYAYTLDANGKVIQTDITDPRGYLERITFNSDGLLTSKTEAVGTAQQRTTTVDRQTGSNLMLSTTDGLGRKTSQTYDAKGNVLSMTEMADSPEARTATMTYDSVFNHVTSVTDWLNRATTFDYDTKGNLIKTTDPLGKSTIFTYTSAGQLASTNDPLGNKSQFVYQAGHLVSITNALGETTTQFIDQAGRVTSQRDSRGLVTRYEYDAFNQLTKTIDPLQGNTSFVYDPNNNLLSVTDARNNPTSYIYNNMDQRTTRTDPLLRQETYVYDNNGNLQQTTDRKNQITTNTYDPLNRLIHVQYHDGSVTDFTYDAGNRLTQVVDSISGTVTMTYDNFDRLMSQTSTQGSVNYTYDDAGRRETMTVAGQPPVNYAYDDADRLTQITKGTSSVTMTYDDAGRRLSLTLPNGILSEYSYDRSSQLIAITYRQGSTIIGDLTYEYDKAGNRIKVGGSFARTGLPSSLSSATYNAANHQLTSGVTYDNNGNLTNDGINTYSWNVRNQLISISGVGLNASFQYDGLGRRVNKTINSISTTFLYDGANPVQELNGTTPTANLLTGLAIDEYFSRTDSAGVRYFLTDVLNSTLALTDSNSVVQTEYNYEPFGKVTVTGTANTNSYQYTGRENDGTGLLYYRTRYYHSGFQRFTSEDPSEIAGGHTNLFLYVFNTPANFIDPNGLAPGDKYSSRDCAAWHAIMDIIKKTLEKNLEYSGLIYKNRDGTFSYTEPVEGTMDTSPGVEDMAWPDGTIRVGGYHTHPDLPPPYAPESFSVEDAQNADYAPVVEYIGTPNTDKTKKIKSYTPVPNKPLKGEIKTLSKKKCCPE